MFKNTFFTYPPFLKQLYSSSVCTPRLGACLFKTSLLNNSVRSDWFALTGLSRHHQPCFYISSAQAPRKAPGSEANFSRN